MRILQIDHGGENLVQGLVRAEWPLRNDLIGGQASSWIQLFLRSASLWPQTRPLSAAVRIEIEPGKAVTTLHSFVATKADEARLRTVLAAFMRTDQMRAGHTEGPQEGEELVGRFFHPDEPRAKVDRRELHSANGLAIYPNVRISDQLPRLLQTLADLGIAFAYEFQAAPWSPPRDQLRRFLFNAERLFAVPGLPERIVQDQRALRERVRSASYLGEECISARTPEQIRLAADALETLLQQSPYAQFGAAPKTVELGAEEARAFGCHVHTRAMFKDDSGEGEISAALPIEDVDRTLSCLPLGFTPQGVPPAGPEPLVFSLGPIGPDSSGGAGGGSAPAQGAEPYVFVSYARSDGQKVYPLVEELGRTGALLWIDKKIVGGDDWVNELELRIMNCVEILAFVSTSFVGSKYCGREIRFADALDKKIVPIFLEDVALSGGLNFILAATQRVFPQNGSHDVLSAIKAHMGAAYAGPAA